MEKEKIDWDAIYSLNWRNFLFRLTILISIVVPMVYFLQEIDTYTFRTDPRSIIIFSLQICASIWGLYGFLWITYLTSRFLLSWLWKGLTKGLRK